MTRLAAGIGSLGLLLAAALTHAGGPQQPAAADPRKVVLTAKDLHKRLDLADGDFVELWLPSSMPFGWVLNETPLLTRERLSPEELEEIQRKQAGGAGPPSPVRPPPSRGASRSTRRGK